MLALEKEHGLDAIVNIIGRLKRLSMNRVCKIPMVRTGRMNVRGMKSFCNQHLAGQKSHHVHDSPHCASHLDLSKGHVGLSSVLPETGPLGVP